MKHDTERKIIGIGGKLRSGKDTVADHLVSAHGFTKLGTSSPLLRAALVLDPVIPDFPTVGTSSRLSAVVESIGYVEAKTHPEVRRFLQVLGTDFGRNMVDPNVWVTMFEKEIRDTPGDVVITGLRFPNEVDLITLMGGDTWYISREHEVEQLGTSHASENAVSRKDFRYSVSNLGTLRDLYYEVDNILRLY